MSAPTKTATVADCCLPQPTAVTGDVSVDLAGLFNVLSNPATLHLFQAMLRDRGCMTSLGITATLSPVDTSASLTALRSAGLVQGVIDGTHSCFCVNMETLSYMRSMLAKLGLTAAPPNGVR